MSCLTFAREMLKNLFSPPVTTEYPLKPKQFVPGVRGKVVNNIDNCIFCGMCQRNCPADAITVDRVARTWTINPFSCVQCRGCVENCPKKCLSMEEHYTDPATAKSDVVMQGKPLPPPPPPKPPVAPEA